VTATDGLPADHNLIYAAGFAVLLDGAGSPINVTVPATQTDGPRSIDDLVADVQAALDAAGLAGQVAAGHDGERLPLVRLGHDPARSIQITTADDEAVDELHLAAGQVSSPVHDQALDPELDISVPDLFHPQLSFQPQNFASLLDFNLGQQQVPTLFNQLGTFL